MFPSFCQNKPAEEYEYYDIISSTAAASFVLEAQKTKGSYSLKNVYMYDNRGELFIAVFGPKNDILAFATMPDYDDFLKTLTLGF